MAEPRGYGQKGQDWSYLTAKNAIATQTGNVTDPTVLGVEFEIDTTVRATGAHVERARQQTLVIFVVPHPAATLDRTSAVLHLWLKADWDKKACVNDKGSSSSSSEALGCLEIPSLDDLDEIDRWALISASIHTDAVAGDGAVAFSFPWLPAGVYKAALAAGLVGKATIVEQHTE